MRERDARLVILRRIVSAGLAVGNKYQIHVDKTPVIKRMLRDGLIRLTCYSNFEYGGRWRKDATKKTGKRQHWLMLTARGQDYLKKHERVDASSFEVNDLFGFNKRQAREDAKFEEARRQRKKAAKSSAVLRQERGLLRLVPGARLQGQV